MSVKNIFYSVASIVGVVFAPLFRGYLWLSRHVIKPYLKYETWLYRVWWKHHCERIQLRLDMQRKHKRATN